VASSTDELAEFHTLSVKVSNNTASETERARWRLLRGRLAPGAMSAPPPPPPSPSVTSSFTSSPTSPGAATGVPMAPLSLSPSSQSSSSQSSSSSSMPMAPLSVPASGPNAVNARQHARASTRKLKVAIAPVTALHATFTEEVSPGGLKLKLPMNVEPGAAMVVRLDVGLPGPLLVNARVAWCRRDGGHYLVGLSFVGLRDDERERIETWTTSNSLPAGATTPSGK
jgi:hypothetical protein